ncbi:uncharacterized protein LOC105697625 [Orussus abietinus]|uniref:uncharacterized protein LOC105697625 n=1 Tax=Orussus abietinus TaxID=222816 RepID=UPI0006269F5D|nr:uncharacterized protein LOC105697625 [Orussus abietinus]XP_012276532.1 uncharacterized protein LOC105697625 [Orussus abietinus]
MQLQVLLLGLIVCSTSALTFPDKDHAGFRANPQRSVQFGESIRDWIKKVRDRVLGKKNPIQFPNEIPDEAKNTQLLEQQTSNSWGFFLDLSTLTFDPLRDWGFRVGSWYFIKKGDEETWNWSEAIDWEDSSQPEIPVPEYDWRINKDENESPILTRKSDTEPLKPIVPVIITSDGSLKRSNAVNVTDKNSETPETRVVVV